jgi:hypothetical protein
VGRGRTKLLSDTPYWPSDFGLFSFESVCLRRRKHNHNIAMAMIARKTTPETTPAIIALLDDSELEAVETVPVGDDVASPMLEVVNRVVEPARPAPTIRDAVVGVEGVEVEVEEEEEDGEVLVYEDCVAVRVEDKIEEDCVDTVREVVWDKEAEVCVAGAPGQYARSQALTEQQPIKLFALQTYHCCPAGQSPGVVRLRERILCDPSSSYY